MEKKIELIVTHHHTEGMSRINLKIGEFQTNYNNPIDSYLFWEEMEKQTNRALFKLKKLNPELSFDFDLHSMAFTQEQKKAQLIEHLYRKYPSVDAEKVFNIIETNIKKIIPTGPDDNHPNPSLKFSIDSDFMKSFIISTIEAYNK